VHADSLLKKGELYCQALKRFKAIEDSNVRGDCFEGLSHWFQPKDITITIKPERSIPGVPQEIVIYEKDLAAPITVQTREFDYFLVYCMYAVAIDDFHFEYSSEEERVALAKTITNSLMEQVRIDGRVRYELGNVAIVITNVKEFLSRVQRCIGSSVRHGFVQYFDENTQTAEFTGLNTIFAKRSLYRYQQEYRFAIPQTNSAETMLYCIGPLDDIARKTTVGELAKAIAITVT